MTESMVMEIDCTTGEEILRPMTEAELELRQQMMDAEVARNAAVEAEIIAKAEAKASGEAKLAALGLTVEEIAALSK